MTSVTKDIKFISIRKLKKYFIVRSVCKCYISYSLRYACVYVHLNVDVSYRDHPNLLKLPNLYINKKKIESLNTKTNRIYNNNVYVYEKLFIDLVSYPSWPYNETMTFYSIFESESEYLKWKLKL